MGEQRRLLAAGAAADLDDNVLVVVGIFREQKDAELLLETGDVLRGPVELLAGQLFQIGIREQGLGFIAVGQALPVLPVRLHQRSQFLLLLVQAPEQRGVRVDFRLLQALLKDAVFTFDLFQSVQHDGPSCPIESVLPNN